MKRIVFVVAAALSSALVLLSGCSGKKQNKVVHVYSIIHEEETEALCNLFTEKTGIKVEYLRATTGELVNRILTEKSAPQADILLGGASNYHINLSNEGCLEPYASALAKDIPSYAKSADNTWTGFCVLTLGIGVNKARFAEKFPGAAYPATWEDLTNPVFKDEIVMTNPAASSTAYLFVQNQLQRLGWDAGWDYLASLSQLVGQFPDSGSAPPKLIGTGEYALGVAYLHALTKYNAQGFDIQLVAPKDSVGDVDCVSIMKNCSNLDGAKKFVDFILSAEAETLMSSIDFTIPVNKDAVAPAGAIPVSEISLIDYDAKLASSQKDEVIARWTELVK
ncbi:MAG: ABC transporter substrate-binding protein [Treponema sp.]|nr:ABC transporter substrate-binding protein [Treponema sp.]